MKHPGFHFTTRVFFFRFSGTRLSSMGLNLASYSLNHLGQPESSTAGLAGLAWLAVRLAMAWGEGRRETHPSAGNHWPLAHALAFAHDSFFSQTQLASVHHITCTNTAL